MTDDLSPAQIRRQRFELVRRGFDPQEVGIFLESVADRLAAAERAVEEAEQRLSATAHELDDARAAEEALQLTMVAATQAKEEMLGRATAQAEEIRVEASRTAEATVAQARRQALQLIDESRREAEEVVTAARSEHSELLEQVDQLRKAVSGVRSLLGSMAEANAPTLDAAEEAIEHPERVAAGTISFQPPSATGAAVAAAAVEPEASVAVVEVDRQDVDEAVAVEVDEAVAVEVDEAVAAPEGADPAGGAEGEDDAAEVERLLRQLRGR